MGVTPPKTPPRHRLRRYGLTPEDWAELLAMQGYRCAICRRRFGPGRAPHVDHDHRTGATRGLTCFRDNYEVLGHLGEDPAYYRSVADYLEDPPARRLPGGPRRHVDAPPVNGAGP